MQTSGKELGEEDSAEADLSGSKPHAEEVDPPRQESRAGEVDPPGQEAGMDGSQLRRQGARAAKVGAGQRHAERSIR